MTNVANTKLTDEALTVMRSVATSFEDSEADILKK